MPGSNEAAIESECVAFEDWKPAQPFPSFGNVG